MAALEMGGKQYISNGWEKDWVWKQACLRGSQEAFTLGAIFCYKNPRYRLPNAGFFDTKIEF
jgi:hypothetical protein